MKHYLLYIALLLPFFLKAQEFVEVSYGASYTDQVFFQLSDCSSTTITDSNWDIAFTTVGFQDAGIFINEAAALSGTELLLYLAPTNNFEDDINPADLTERLVNDEQSWDWGAFNATRSEMNPLDYGWGLYDPVANQVNGTTVFVIQLRDGSFKKFMIESLVLTTYNFKYADLNGANELTFTLDKSDFPGTDLALFSLTDGEAIDVPNTNEWDLFFTRYTTPLDAGDGEILEYVLTGVISGTGIEVAQADEVDPQTVDYEDYINEFSSALDIIGYDWKFFDMGTFQWIIPDDIAYFVKDRTGTVWRIVFVDFEGSSTGNAVFQKDEVGVVSSVDDPQSVFEDFTIFPNPASADVSISFSLKKAGQVNMTLLTATGQVVWNNTIAANSGFNVANLPNRSYPAGSYVVRIEFDTGEQQFQQINFIN